MKIIFLGTPDFAAKTLEILLTSHHEILAVVSQPDRKGNRNKIMPTPVKEVALKNNIPVMQYEKISKEGIEDLKKLNADIMVTCAFGQILSDEVLNITPNGVINTHASLLPKYRGSSPIQWSIINGETETGVTIMQTVKEIDAGDIIYCVKTPIDSDETAGELFDRLSVISGQALIKALDLIEEGIAVRIKQDHSQATFCKMLTKKDGLIDFDNTAQNIKNFVRGMNPWPCAFTEINGTLMKVHKIGIVDIYENIGVSGQIIVSDKMLIVSTKDVPVRLEVIQMQNSKKMTDVEYLCGHKIETGLILGSKYE